MTLILSPTYIFYLWILKEPWQGAFLLVRNNTIICSVGRLIMTPALGYSLGNFMAAKRSVCSLSSNLCNLTKELEKACRKVQEKIRAAALQCGINM
jgi:hypothetical protein